MRPTIFLAVAALTCGHPLAAILCAENEPDFADRQGVTEETCAQVRRQIDIADDLYWLGMEEDGNYRAFGRGLEHVDKAKRLVGDSASPQAADLLQEINALEADLAAQMQLTGENFFGWFPVVRLLDRSLFLDDETTGTFELLDDAREVSAERTAEALRATVVSQWKNVAPVAVVISSDPDDPLLENQVAVVLDQSPEFYIHTRREVMRFLSADEWKRLWEEPLASELREKLLEEFHTSHLLMIRIYHGRVGGSAAGEDARDGASPGGRTGADEGGIAYCDIEGLVYDRDRQEPVQSVATRGYCRDRGHRQRAIVATHVVLLLLAIVIYTYLVRVRIGRWPRWCRPLAGVTPARLHGGGSSASGGLALQRELKPWLIDSPLAPALAFFFGRVLPWVIVPLARSIAPEPDTIIWASAWWPGLLGIGLVLGPLLVCWLAPQYVPGMGTLMRFDRRGGAVCVATGMGIAAYVATALLLFFERAEFWWSLITVLGAVGALGIASYLFGRSLDRIDARHPAWLTVLVVLAVGIGFGLCSGSPFWFWGCLLGGLACITPLTERRTRTHIEAPSVTREILPTDVGQLAELAENPPYHPFEAFRQAERRVDRVRQGETCWLRLVGPSGYGKTATANAVIDHLRQRAQSGARAVLVLRAACEPGEGAATPYAPFRRALADVFSTHLLAPRDQQLGGVDRALEGFLQAIVPFANFLAPPTESGPTSVARQEELFAAVSHAIRGHAGKRPVVLFIDDVQWIDDSSQELLNHLHADIPHGGNAPVLVMTACRRESHAEPSDGGGVVVSAEELLVTLPSLAQQETILASMGCSAISAHRLVKCLGEDTARHGALFWLFRAVAHLARSGIIERSDGEFVLKSEYLYGRALPVSDDLRRVLAEQVEKSSQHRHILQCAACIGQEFTVGVLAHSLGNDRLEVVQALDAIERETGIVVDAGKPDNRYRFASSLLFEEIRHQLGLTPAEPGSREEPAVRSLRPLVREYHARIAAALGENVTRNPGAVFDVARHYHTAGAAFADEGLEYCLRAVRAACAIFECDQARRYLEMARDCAMALGQDYQLEEEELRIECARSHLSGQDTQRVARDAIDFARWHPQVSTSFLSLAATLCCDAGRDSGRGDFFEEGCRLGEKIVLRGSSQSDIARGRHFLGICLARLAQEESDEQEAEVLLNTGKQHLRDALGLLTDAATDDVDAQRLRAEVANSLAELLREGTPGEMAGARELFKLSLRIKCRPEIYDLPGQARSHGGLGRLFRYSDPPDVAAARHHFAEDLRISEQIGDLRGQVIMHSELGDCDRLDENWPSAAEHFQRSRQRAWLDIDKYFAGARLMNCLCRAGDLPTANDLGEELLELARRRPVPRWPAAELVDVLDKYGPQLDTNWVEPLRERAAQTAPRQ